MRWLLGGEWGTLGHMIREELQRVRERMGRRAWSYEKRLEKGKGGIIARKCLKEIKKRAMRGGELSMGGRKKEFFQQKRHGC